MKFQVILLSFLSAAALIAANPIAAAPEDGLLDLVDIDPILALIAILLDPATPGEPTEPDEPEPEPVVAKCPVISNVDVPSRTCPGVQCDVCEFCFLPSRG